ncbi:hypothetical protein MYCTH_2131264 [Thermothelomyces thermophilus ATCC 42464]|uniref:Heterokaryon incompatibility domain-containing protein n=1 Tax=Thermothelomyces thermophilus (strain ATCC 42464 / BCRC 31852 / DSM 1799) TaxID=573729 RepID=G2QNK5_THET4|nr:uncharacterized protein MYCTH_2131264 [Thermothelomyces thermophilus ATCC 42464]AEO62078.1 hypothetical protein MYCTH_2131264 [Thermothelomyces thermophilus ATCC 42464]
MGSIASNASITTDPRRRRGPVGIPVGALGGRGVHQPGRRAREKTAQVRLIREIYSRPVRMLVWLGEDGGGRPRCCLRRMSFVIQEVALADDGVPRLAICGDIEFAWEDLARVAYRLGVSSGNIPAGKWDNILDLRRPWLNMIRGLVPKERLLEWYIEDGWELLCKFLGKPVPDVPFPHANAVNGGWKAREEQANKRWIERAFLNLILLGIGLVIAILLARLYLF